MNSQRAQQIARSFSGVTEMQVEQISGGLLVRQHGLSCYFVREACFWSFVFKTAAASRCDVAEIEAKMADLTLAA